MIAQTIPANMREVTKDEFWVWVMKTTLNIHPTPQRFHTDWKSLATGKNVGWTSHGYATPFNAPAEKFAINKQGVTP